MNWYSSIQAGSRKSYAIRLMGVGKSAVSSMSVKLFWS